MLTGAAGKMTIRISGCHPMHSQLIFGPNAILGTSIMYSALHNVHFVN